MRLIVQGRLPYHLPIEKGLFPPEAEPLVHHVTQFDGEAIACSVFFLQVERDIPEEDEQREILRGKLARALLSRINRIIRWYRILAHAPEVLEVTRADLSPILFLDPQSPAELLPRLIYERSVQTTKTTLRDLNKALQEALAKESEPEVEQLVLLDAEHAFATGRYRECVLHCWAVIDTAFSRKYDALVKRRLQGEYRDGYDFVAGHEIPMKVRMTAMLNLLSNRSLSHEPNLWGSLTKSYACRNSVVHRAEQATEDDARTALDVAQRVRTFLVQL